MGFTGFASFQNDVGKVEKDSKIIEPTLIGSIIKSSECNFENVKIKYFDEDLDGCESNSDNVHVVLVGDIFEDDFLSNNKISKSKYLRNVLFKEGIEACVKLNGSYAFLINDVKNNLLHIGTDQNSHIPVYYTEDNNKLYFSWDVSTVINSMSREFRLNYSSVFTTLLFGGMGFGDDTRFDGVKRLEPGSCISFGIKGIKKYSPEPFYYRPRNISYNSLLNDSIEALYSGVKRRIKKFDRLGISLSGGIDSRIVLASIKKNKYKGVLYSHTYGKPDFVENTIARKISNYFNVEHIGIELPDLIYIKYAKDGVFYSGGYSHFSYGPQIHLNATLKNKYDLQGIFLGSALDCTAGNAWMHDKIYNFKNRKELFKFYTSGHITKFSKAEFIEFFKEKNNGIDFYNSAIKTLNKSFEKIPDGEIPDINSSFFLENRGKRWHDRDCVYPLYSHRLLVPTYDRDFLSALSAVPFKYRRDDRFRIDMLKKINKGASNIIYDTTMQPAWLKSPYTKKFRAKLDELEKIQLQVWFESARAIYLPSNRYDANFLEWIRVYPEYQNFFQDILIGENSFFSNQLFRRKKIQSILDNHIGGNNTNHRLLVMLASAELTNKLFSRVSPGVNTNFKNFSNYFSSSIVN